MAQTALLAGLLGLPVAVAIWLVLTEHGPPGQVRWVVSLTAGATAICALSLLPFAGQIPPPTLTWLPTAGAMRLSLATTNLLATTATASAAVVVYLVGDTKQVESPGPRSGALTLLALAAGNLTFLSGHFLLRYVALEIVGLCIALAPLLERRGPAPFSRAGWVYFLLRFGDAGLLAAILLTGAQSGVYEIQGALEAVHTLSPQTQTWISLGFFLAVAVKVGMWPFHAWIDSGRHLSRSTYTWLYATLMPNLGLYLLYKVAGLPPTAPPLRNGLLVFGVGAGALPLLSILIQPLSRKRLPARSAALLGAILWCLTLLGNDKLAWWGLLALSVIRLPLYLSLSHEEEPTENRQTLTRWVGWNQRGGALVQRLHAGLELGILKRGPEALARGLAKMAEFLHTRVEVKILEQGVDASAAKIVDSAKLLHVAVEQRSLEALLHIAVNKILQLSHRLRDWHTGRLRANLLWVVLCLILAIGLALAY
ncbi:MAG: hypothetical protein JXB35_14705 [Anaerolineae bacterium]|nr:hypothetical protein [Anaerolineae bacterium]